MTPLADCLTALHTRLGRPLDLLETGSIRSVDDRYQDDDGWSTLTLARHVAAHGGRPATSIDLDVSAARTVLAGNGLAGHVRLIEGHSIDVLAGMVADGAGPRLDLAYLDSDNNADLLLHEYLLAARLVRTGGLILVDDVDMGSSTVVKGHQLVPWLDRNHVPYRIDRRQGATLATGVLVVGM